VLTETVSRHFHRERSPRRYHGGVLPDVLVDVPGLFTSCHSRAILGLTNELPRRQIAMTARSLERSNHALTASLAASKLAMPVSIPVARSCEPSCPAHAGYSTV
jgi:hypothetical protein